MFYLGIGFLVVLFFALHTLAKESCLTNSEQIFWKQHSFFMIRRLWTKVNRLHQLIFQGKGHPVFGRNALISFSGPIRYLIHIHTDCIFRQLKGTNIFAVYDVITIHGGWHPLGNERVWVRLFTLHLTDYHIRLHAKLSISATGFQVDIRFKEPNKSPNKKIKNT